ncbi:MAG: FAD-binding oxidoreductase [Pseudomonadota bacterium]
MTNRRHFADKKVAAHCSAQHQTLSENDTPARIVPGRARTHDEDVESLDVWGFNDSKFEVNDKGVVALAGSRYDLSGEELPALLPWIRQVLSLPIDPKDIHPYDFPRTVPEPVLNDAFIAALKDILPEEQISQKAETRQRHGHGHTLEEMYAIKYGQLSRIPDVVVYPSEENQVSEIVKAAKKYNACLIPFGGGTSVTEALQCPKTERRMIASVDMRRMNRIEWIDPVNRMACIQAGAVGRHIVEQLADYGFSMGHEPDSIEFSTLGGWIATNASGMKKNKYGNIEDLVLDVTVVTAFGTLERDVALPRESVGTDPRQAVFGSEGNLGIVTSAIVKLFPLPEVQRYGSILFKNFELGMNFMHALSQQHLLPASVRLMDNLQFQFGQALKPRSVGWRSYKSKLEKYYALNLRGFDPDKMVACTLVFEGRAEDVKAQEAMVYKIGAQYGGMKAGGSNGERGYQLTFGIAYVRDFVMNHYILAESFETSVSWSQALLLCQNVKQRVMTEHAERNLPGRPFITCRATQVYDTGVCIYFYLAFSYKGVDNPTQVFNEIEVAAREEILNCGGALSHHHGVGKLRKRFMPNVMSDATLDWNRKTKHALDPNNIFGCENHLTTGVEAEN